MGWLGIANSSGMIMGARGCMHGVIADSYGIETSLQFVIVIVLIGAAASLLLPNRARQM